MSTPFRISFVCTGNICRSPMGEAVLRRLAADAGLADRIEVTSRGTEGWHEGKPADPRTVAALEARGYEGASLRAAQFTDADAGEHDLVVALARNHEEALLERGVDPARLVRFTAYDPESPADPDVFDPYYSDEAAFEAVLDQVERGAAVLLAELRERLDV